VVAFSLIAFLPMSDNPLAGKEPKMKPEELVAKHLGAIGAPQALAAVRTRAISGIARAVGRVGGQGQIIGRGNILSEGRMIRIGMNFNQLEYPGEQFAFDGDKVTVGQVQPGRRSALSSFFYTYDALLKEGLLGGATTTAWALLDVAGRQPKLDYAGLKKIQGKQLHEVKYKAKKSMGDLTAALYFDPEDFRHVFSQYRLVIPAAMGRTPTESSGQRETIYTIQESFSDFQVVDDLTLPHSYKLTLTIEGQSNTFLGDWFFTVEQVLHNQPLDSKFFVVQ